MVGAVSHNLFIHCSLWSIQTILLFPAATATGVPCEVKSAVQGMFLNTIDPQFIVIYFSWVGGKMKIKYTTQYKTVIP